MNLYLLSYKLTQYELSQKLALPKSKETKKSNAEREKTEIIKRKNNQIQNSNKWRKPNSKVK